MPSQMTCPTSSKRGVSVGVSVSIGTTATLLTCVLPVGRLSLSTLPTDADIFCTSKANPASIPRAATTYHKLSRKLLLTDISPSELRVASCELRVASCELLVVHSWRFRNSQLATAY